MTNSSPKRIHQFRLQPKAFPSGASAPHSITLPHIFWSDRIKVLLLLFLFLYYWVKHLYLQYVHCLFILCCPLHVKYICQYFVMCRRLFKKQYISRPFRFLINSCAGQAGFIWMCFMLPDFEDIAFFFLQAEGLWQPCIKRLSAPFFQQKMVSIFQQ